MSSQAPTTRARRSNKWATRITVSGLSLLLIFVVLAYVTVVLGHVRGEEIATATFERRTFEYYQLPVVEIQISGIARDDSTGELEQYLIKNKLISVAKAKTPPDESLRWDLIKAHRFNVVIGRGEAEILANYLNAENADSKNVWVEWSTEHPELAKVVWPVVVSVSQQELFIFVPELLELAANATDPADLKIELDALQSEQYLRVATIQQRLDRHALAVELFSHSLDRSPRQVTALERRAVSLAALGEQDKAAADLAQVRELQRF